MAIGDKKYFRISEIGNQKITDQYSEGFKKGYSCGFRTADDYISYRPGFHTMIYGHPYSGKTQFAMDEMIYLSRKYNLKHLIYLPESGRKEEVIGDLLMVYLGQRMYGAGAPGIELDKVEDAIKFIDQHFVLISPEDGVLTLKEAYNMVVTIYKVEGFVVDMFWIDHLGYISKEEGVRYFNPADYLKDSLQFVLRAGLKLNVHTVMLAHLRDMEMVTDKDTGIRYSPKPHPSEISGGQQAWYNGYQMIGIWRTPFGVVDPETGVPYEPNETRLMIQKSKPKGVGRIGVIPIFFDDQRQKFYEKIDGAHFFVGGYDNPYNPKIEIPDDDMPF